MLFAKCWFSHSLLIEFSSSKLSVYTCIVAMAFLVTTFLFVIYERLVTRRERTKNAALRVISSMFPSAVQERVLKGATDGRGTGSGDQDNLIASFYPATTVLFGMYLLLLMLTCSIV